MVAVRRRAAEAEGAEGSGAFLGVIASVRGLAWRERLTTAGRGAAVAISQRHGLPEVLGRVLAGRGVGIDEVPLVLEPTIKAMMPNPSVLRDMDRAACRLADAIQLRQTIAVFGDYDVDGAASSALLQRYLAHHGLAARIYIPDRLAEGYGPNVEALQRLFGDGAQLIVTVDCGTTSFEPLADARRLGADVVVIDHHQADEHLPEACAIVNPNRQDDLSNLGYLCAAGLTFMVLVAVTRELRARGLYGQRLPEPNLLQLLDLVALATVCDMVPLTGLNRAYVSRGLAVMASRRNVGLRALLDAAGTNQAPTPYTLGFILGPRINAGGRIGNAALGARLLAIDDETEAVKIAVTLDRLNRERKAIEAAMLAEAVAMAERQLEADAGTPLLLVGSQDWHKGVVGLVASRLVERFGRPACAIAWEREEGTGSLRSVCGVDIGSAVRAAVARGLLVKGGGHAMAAGLTVERGRFEEARAFLSEALRLP
ncbi:MAG TPA: single-stranded-DNA-specific exonuclease RecJ, partial [Hyphomicrobiaceae bacterium]|nr:single-stranded-DNA-specific exonuclease RecJ [Hyphomicrobiaceae bacterium]